MGEPLTLWQFCSNIRYVIESQALSQWVQAEIAQISGSFGSHYYLELVQKNEDNDNPIAKLRCTIWARQAASIIPPFEEATGCRLAAGMKILCYIAPAFHEVYGLSGNILMIDPSFTIGEIEARRRAIIKQLVADGIAEMNKELPLPTLIKRIAVISSSAAAGYGDFCSQLKGAGLEIAYRMDLFPAAMQGTEAERSVIDALSAIINSHVDYDVVVIIRGGGSRMDLACFDSYDMASAVAQFPLPVIAGIGHDRDHSVVDMVANTALKTPTAVAEFISEHNEQLLLLLDELKDRLAHAADSIVSSKKSSIDQLSSLLSVSAKAKCSLTKFKLENIISRLKAATSIAITTEKASVQHLEDKVAALDPNRVLDRGYSITTDSDGRTVNSVRQVSSGDTITTYVRDGALTSVLK